MVALGRPSSRQERREWWRRQLALQQSANRSVADFCRQLGVSVKTFYQWKKRLGEAPSHSPEQVAAEPTSRSTTTAANFVPVSLVDFGAGPQLEIELANACVVRLKGAIDPSLLQAAINAAGQLHGSCRGDH